MKFLGKHCQLAWDMAMNDCELLCDGLTDVFQRKRFVSSFANALELGLKQILIDNNNRALINRQKTKRNNKHLYRKFKKSNDLNDFFLSLSSEDLNCFYTTNVSRIVKKGTIGVSNADKTDARMKIKLLLNLRNDETHFYIDDRNYLAFDEFKNLYDLFQKIQNYFIKENIINNVSCPFLQTNGTISSHSNFDMSSFNSYNDLVVNSEKNIYLLNQFEKHGDNEDYPYGSSYYVSNPDDLKELAAKMYSHHGPNDPDKLCTDFLMNFNEFYRRFLLLNENNKFHIEHSGRLVLVSRNG